ncbi:MAG: hypothetical protein AB8H47_08105, partial [Bacteroidia bacterium]
MQNINQIFLWLCFFCLPLAILAQEPVTEKSARKQAKEEVKTQKKAAKTLEKATQTKYMVMGLNGRYGLI